MRPQSSTTTRLAAHLRGLREARDLTLAALATRASVSRATLSRIENAEVSPTAETLGALAAVYAMPISQLLAPIEPGFQPVLRKSAQSVWSDTTRAFTRRSVSPRNGRLSIEIVEVDLGPNQEIEYTAPAIPGQEHHIYVLAGALEITVEQVTHGLNAGDCLRYCLFGETEFVTREAGCRYMIVLA